MSRISFPHPTVAALRGHADSLIRLARTPSLRNGKRHRTDLATSLCSLAARAVPGALPLDAGLARLAADATPTGPSLRPVVDRVANHFAAVLPDAAQARLATAAFVAASVLATSGAVAAVAVSQPGHPIPVRRVVVALDRFVEQRATAEARPAVVATPVTEPSGASAFPSASEPIPPAVPAPLLPERIPARRGPLPIGKGMWIWLPERAEGGDAHAIVARAKAVGLSHIYVRTGSSRMGFYAQDLLNRLLPVAHAHGIRVYGWDFPYFEDVGADVFRAVAAILHTTPDGHRIDGFNADIETAREGVSITAPKAAEYGRRLREAVGVGYPLIATVPRPNPLLVQYPMREVVAHFDAIAPMVYWMGRDSGADVIAAMQHLAQYGKPVMPVGQAYDGFAEGGPPGVPGRGSIHRFMLEAERMGATAVSFWSWQHASQEAWDAVRDSTWFMFPPGTPETLIPAQLRGYQTLLTTLGFPTAVTGVWTPEFTETVLAYQREAGLPPTGVIDELTRWTMFVPFSPPTALR